MIVGEGGEVREEEEVSDISGWVVFTFLKKNCISKFMMSH